MDTNNLVRSVIPITIIGLVFYGLEAFQVNEREIHYSLGLIIIIAGIIIEKITSRVINLIKNTFTFINFGIETIDNKAKMQSLVQSTNVIHHMC